MPITNITDCLLIRIRTPITESEMCPEVRYLTRTLITPHLGHKINNILIQQAIRVLAP